MNQNSFARSSGLIIYVAAWAILLQHSCAGAEGIQSDDVQIEAARFTVKVAPHDGRRLVLLRANSDSSSARTVEEDISGFVVGEGWEIRKISLTIWNESHLLAAVERGSKGRFAIDLLLFHRAALDTSRPIVTTTTIHESEKRPVIMAINGKFQGDGIVVVVGTLRNVDGAREVSTATVFIDDCPHPGQPAGRTTKLVRE